MSEQLAIDGAVRTAKALTVDQQRAFDYIRSRDGVTAVELGAHLHAHREKRPHPEDEPCDWCKQRGTSIASSKGLKPLVSYRNEGGQRLYIPRNRRDRVSPAVEVLEPSEEELAANPFAGL